MSCLGSDDYVRLNAQPKAHFVSFLSGGIENVVRFYAEPDEKYYMIPFFYRPCPYLFGQGLLHLTLNLNIHHFLALTV